MDELAAGNSEFFLPRFGTVIARAQAIFYPERGVNPILIIGAEWFKWRHGPKVCVELVSAHVGCHVFARSFLNSIAGLRRASRLGSELPSSAIYRRSAAPL